MPLRILKTAPERISLRLLRSGHGADLMRDALLCANAVQIGLRGASLRNRAARIWLRDIPLRIGVAQFKFNHSPLLNGR